MTPGLDHFGIVAPFYERFIRPQVPEKLIALLDRPGRATFLDVGGGTGRIAQFLRDKAAHVLVVDESMKMLREAGKKDGLRPVCSHAERMPLPDGYFDGVIMVDAFHHMTDQRAAAQELWRVLRPGGRIVVEEPDVRTFLVKLIALGEKAALMRTHFRAPAQIAGMFDALGACTRIERDGPIAWVIADKQDAAR